MNTINFKGNSGKQVCFGWDNGNVWVRSLFGLLCGDNGNDWGFDRSCGPAVLKTDDGRFEASAFQAIEKSVSDTELAVMWQVTGHDIKLRTVWTFCPVTSTLSRRDTILNAGDKPITIRRYLSRVTFQTGSFELYSQSSRWATENQGQWVPLHCGSVVLRCDSGRTTQSATPYACLRDRDNSEGIAFHILPCGNWTMRFSVHPRMQGTANVAVELGMSDQDLCLSIAAGTSWEAPEVLIQPLTDGKPESAAPLFHKYVNGKYLRNAKKTAPVLYNTWLDQFDNLEPERLLKHLSALKEMGCEVLVIDTGWFGGGDGDWHNTAGDWLESRTTAFKGRMSEFADGVREAGLGFGLWMEPEHVGHLAALRSSHPEWFKGSVKGGTRLDIENPVVYNHILGEMSRLIETYKLAWMKIDFNIELGYDERGSELYSYYKTWYGILDTLRARYPGTFFEGCASGGMRSDFNTLSHFDGHDLSDSSNTVDMIRIYEGAILRLPPGRITKWVAIRSIGNVFPDYPGTVANSPESFAVATATGWQPVQLTETVNLDFAAFHVMTGMFGLSGDPSSLSTEARSRLKEHVGFYKAWREFITGSYAHLLTPVQPMTNREGWSVLQMLHPDIKDSLVFTYRLQDSRSMRRFKLHDLDTGTNYRVCIYPQTEGFEEYTASGLSLMTEGIDLTVEKPGLAKIYIVKPCQYR